MSQKIILSLSWTFNALQSDMAGNISKHFYEMAKSKTCADFHHPGFTCLQSAVMCCKSGFLGSAKFYFPVCFVSNKIKFKKLFNNFICSFRFCLKFINGMNLRPGRNSFATMHAAFSLDFLSRQRDLFSSVFPIICLNLTTCRLQFASLLP